MLRAGRAYWFSTVDGSTQSVDLLRGLDGAIPSPVDIASSLTASGLATAIAADIIAAGVMRDVTGQGINTTLGAPSQDGTVAALPTGISNTGVPLLTRSTLVKNQPNISQGVGVTSNSATFPITQPGYEVLLTIFAAGNFLSSYHLTMNWFDSATGLQTGQEDYWFIPGTGSGANAHIIFGTGPTKGDQLVITSAVPAISSVAVSHAYVVLQNSRLFLEDDWNTIQFVPAGVTGAGTDATAGILAASSFSVGAGLGLTRLMPFFNGECSLWASSTSGTSDMDIQILTFADALQVGGTSPTTFEQKTNANGFLYAESISLPAAQCQVLVTNGNAAAKTLAFTVIPSKQR